MGVFIRGGATSGGSAKNWTTEIKAGSVAILRNVNKALFEKCEPVADARVEILENAIDRAALIAERERLKKRMKEINEILKLEK